MFGLVVDFVSDFVFELELDHDPPTISQPAQVTAATPTVTSNPKLSPEPSPEPNAVF